MVLTPGRALGVPTLPLQEAHTIQARMGLCSKHLENYQHPCLAPQIQHMQQNYLLPQDSEPAWLPASPPDRMETHFAVI